MRQESRRGLLVQGMQRGRLSRRLSIWGFLFVAPALALFLTFSLYPFITAFRLSLYEYDMLTTKRFIGLANYLSLFHDPLFRRSCAATAVYVFGSGVPLWVMSLGIALLLNNSFLRFKGFFRACYYLPVIMSLVAASVVWKIIFHPYGLVNYFLSSIGVQDPIFWLTDSKFAPLALIIMGVWKRLGYYTVMFLAGLQAIPREYYEAAEIDGASPLARFWNVTFPLLKPTTAFVIIVSIILGLQSLVPQMLMTNGGPSDATRVIALLIYQTGFVYLKMGYASAMSVLLFAFIMLFTMLQLKILRPKV